MNAFGDLIGMLFFLFCLALAVYGLVLISRFVNSFERMATSLEVIARKYRDGEKPGSVKPEQG